MSRNSQWKVLLLGVSALVLVVALVFASGTTGAPGELYPELPEKDAFAEQALEALRATGITGELTYDPERFLIQSSTPDDLARWGISYEQAHTDAMANLRRLDSVPLRHVPWARA
ncbi:hypothetical protein [Corallococcus sicarius]|uniref:Uncharacterized protein n=1 Tax=Corallococcus sicarius TaxID=2316726 RepID=A0A3A8MNI6_9BACT|nr:hypothetical protein [Corallococcus sicarius]RKH29122.1 hypothetical protein D7X12_39815 [Corallococcus sicarius]